MRLGEYLDAELTPAKFAEIEAYLRVCEPCRAFLATYRKTTRRGYMAIAPNSWAAFRTGDRHPGGARTSVFMTKE
jgi:anti-sigma factor RsiW